MAWTPGLRPNRAGCARRPQQGEESDTNHGDNQRFHSLGTSDFNPLI